jgi:hypothetical protein
MMGWGRGFRVKVLFQEFEQSLWVGCCYVVSFWLERYQSTVKTHMVINITRRHLVCIYIKQSDHVEAAKTE